MENKKDLRVVKTQNLLFNTLMELIKKKSFEEIKVSDICSNALINRSTFYAHYNDKYELLLDFINNFKKNLLEILGENKNSLNTKEYFIELIKLLLDHIDDKRDIYYSILINNQNSIMMDVLFDVVNNDVKSRIREDKSINQKVPSEIISKFYLGAVVCIGIEWLKSSGKYSKQDLIDYLELLIPENVDKI
jgi:AcrR family transcriptional regulator